MSFSFVLILIDDQTKQHRIGRVRGCKKFFHCGLVSILYRPFDLLFFLWYQESLNALLVHCCGHIGCAPLILFGLFILETYFIYFIFLDNGESDFMKKKKKEYTHK